ncbi:hypothetical protein LINGRAHAP2_LOCUS3733 [Linum grandiflorum]
MVEIVEADGGGVNRYVTKKKAKETNMVEITLKTIGPSPPSRIILPSPITVRDLRKFIAEYKHLPIENLRLVLHGKMLEDCGEDDLLIKLKNNDSLIVAVKPKAPAKHLQDGCEDDDDLWAGIILWFILAPVANRWHIGPLYVSNLPRRYLSKCYIQFLGSCCGKHAGDEVVSLIVKV